jgi:hypothetical protein
MKFNSNLSALSKEATENGFVIYFALTSCEQSNSSSSPSRSYQKDHKDQHIGQYVLKGFADYYDDER